MKKEIEHQTKEKNIIKWNEIQNLQSKKKKKDWKNLKLKWFDLKWNKAKYNGKMWNKSTEYKNILKTYKIS